MHRLFAIRRRRRPVLWLLAAAVCVATQPAGARAQSDVDWVQIEGCWSALPLGIALSREFNRSTDGMATDFTARDSQMVAMRLLDRHCDVGLVLHSLGPSADKDLRGKCEAFPLGRFAVGVAVNAKNPVRMMATEDLGNVFHGKVDTWGAVDGTRGVGRIVLYSTDIASTEAHIFKHTVMRRRFAPALEPYESHETPHQRPSADGVMGAVIKDATAIGFFMVGPETRLDDRVRLIRIGKDRTAPGVGLAGETIAHGSYPLVDTLTIYLHPEAPATAREFVEFATGPDAAKILKQFGLWPENELEKVRGEQRVADAKAGKGSPVRVCDLAGVGEGLKAASWDFARAKVAVQVTLDTAGGSVEGAVERLETGAVELLVVDGALEEAVRGRVMEMGGAEAVLGSRAVGVVVHPHNPFNELAKDDVRQILSGEIDRWPGLSGTAERIVLYGLPAASPLMQMVDEVLRPRGIGFQPVISGDKPKPDATPDKLEAYPTKRAAMTRRPDTGRVILSVAAQPGAMGLVDLAEFPRHETKVKLVALLPAGERQAVPPAPDRLPEGYPLAQPVTLYVSGKASDAGRAFFEFLAEGNARDALLAQGAVPHAAARREEAAQPAAMAAMPADFRDVVLGDVEDEAGEAPEASLAPTEAAVERDLFEDDPFQVPEVAAAESEEDALKRGPQQEETAAAGVGLPPLAPAPVAADEGFEAWLADNALPLGLIGLAVVAIAIKLGAVTMKRNRRRNELLRRYRS